MDTLAQAHCIQFGDFVPGSKDTAPPDSRVHRITPKPMINNKYLECIPVFDSELHFEPVIKCPAF